MAENFEDLWALPLSTDHVSIKDKTLLPRYNKSAMQVEVQPIITTPVEVQPKKRKATQKKTATTATKKKQKPQAKKKKATATTATKKKQKPQAKKKPLDRVTTTSSSEVEEGSDVEFTLDKVLKSFADPRSELFVKSLQGELKKFPELLMLTTKDAEADPPDILFGGRRKGYFKCPRLCRVFVLEIFRWLRSRGEWFVKWTNPLTGKSYDGTKVLAHAFTIYYCSMHKPGMSVNFSKRGHLKSTNEQFKRLKK